MAVTGPFKDKTLWFVSYEKVVAGTPEALPFPPGSSTTVTQGDEEVLWSVKLAWEAIGDHCRDGRYEHICKILKAKYGYRLRDLLPTEASEIWLLAFSLRRTPLLCFGLAVVRAEDLRWLPLIYRMLRS